MDGAHKAGAYGIVTACPLCQSNLETRQKEPKAVPIFYFTELLGLAMGLDKEAKGWWKRHLITPKVVKTALG